MKMRLLVLVFAFLLVNISLSAKKMKSFFTPSDAANWVYVLKNKSIPPSTLFTMDAGVLKITDATAGYLRTKKQYRNFILSVDWRWTKVAANSGVLIHIQPNDSIWPICFQVQQKAHAAGDIICMNGLEAKESIGQINATVPKMKPSNEKALGEWNSMKVISKSGTLTVYINGLLQNKITKMTKNKGFIGFQAEGKPMEFRNLAIKKIR